MLPVVSVGLAELVAAAVEVLIQNSTLQTSQSTDEMMLNTETGPRPGRGSAGTAASPGTATGRAQGSQMLSEHACKRVLT